MNIPREVIEKAIEGGWPPENVGKLFPSDIVLDPEFWRCLGKALGWPKHKETVVARDGVVEVIQSDNEFWFDTAHHFVDLILTQAPQEQIDAFWKDLQGKE